MHLSISKAHDLEGTVYFQKRFLVLVPGATTCLVPAVSVNVGHAKIFFQVTGCQQKICEKLETTEPSVVKNQHVQIESI